MVGRGIHRVRVAAVVGGHQQQVARPERVHDGGQAPVGFFQRLSVALHVLAVTVELVEVHPVGENQPRGMLADGGQGFGDALGVVLGLGVGRQAAAAVDVVDLAHAAGEHPRPGQPIEQRGLGRRDGQILAALRAAETPRPAHERPGDHAPHLVRRRQEFPGGLADPVELLHRDHLLVRRHLEDAVGRGVDDGLARAQVLLAQLLDDLGARSRLVAQRPPADGRFELFHQLGGKTVRVGGEGMLLVEPGHLPVPGGGVLAVRGDGGPAVGPGGSGRRLQVGQRLDVGQPQANQGGQLQRARGRHVAQGVPPRVAEPGRVGHRADAHAVEHDEHHPAKLASLSLFS